MLNNRPFQDRSTVAVISPDDEGEDNFTVVTDHSKAVHATLKILLTRVWLESMWQASNYSFTEN